MLQYITYWFQVRNQRMFSFTSNKKGRLAVPRALTVLFWMFQSLPLQRQPAASHALYCTFAALKHRDAQSTAGGLSVTVTPTPSLPILPSFHLASSCASSSNALTFLLFIKWNGAWNSKFSFVYMLTGTQLIVRKISVPLCHTDDLLALMEGKSSFRRSAVMLCLAVCQEIRLENVFFLQQKRAYVRISPWNSDKFGTDSNGNLVSKLSDVFWCVLFWLIFH